MSKQDSALGLFITPLATRYSCLGQVHVFRADTPPRPGTPPVTRSPRADTPQMGYSVRLSGVLCPVTRYTAQTRYSVQGDQVLCHETRYTPPYGTARAADGTHPTGMHSCSKDFIHKWTHFILLIVIADRTYCLQSRMLPVSVTTSRHSCVCNWNHTTLPSILMPGKNIIKFSNVRTCKLCKYVISI